MSTKQLCTVVAGDLLFGIEVGLVQEVLRFQKITSVPLAAKDVIGLINLRGQIVTAIDLRQRLGLIPHPDSREAFNVVVRGKENLLSFLVDDIGDVIDVQDTTFEEVPALIPQQVGGFVSGVYKLEGGLLFLLNAKTLTEATPSVKE